MGVVLGQHDVGESLVGDVESVAIEGNYLSYRLLPKNTQTINIKYYRKPVMPIDIAGNIPEGIPEHLHQIILVNYILAQNYFEIRGDNPQNNDPQKDNAMYFDTLFRQGVEDLKAFFIDVSKPRKILPRRSFFF